MRSIGCSYLFRQTPGSERVGGLQVTVKPRRGAVGVIDVTLTDYRTKEPLVGLDDEIVQSAISGIHDVANQYGVPLSDFDVQLSDFLFHDVDSHPRIYHQAAKSAFRAALEAWQTKDLA